MAGMTGYFVLDWSILSLSFFNIITILWLGITILLNVDRYTWGVWLMGSGLLAGAAFFISHTAILGQELSLNTDGLNFWWQVGWIPVIIAPFAWYVVILWYSGFWLRPRTPLYQRHRIWFILMTTFLSCSAVLILTTKSIPSYTEIVLLDLSGALTLGGVPVLLLVFPAFMILCILLSIDVLLHKVPGVGVSDDLARQRSHPWLLATAAVLLLVSLLVTIFIANLVRSAEKGVPATISLNIIGLFDLALQFLIALATILLGQAIVSYEVFTGKVLPRRGFFRQWRNLVLIAVGYSFVISWSIAEQLRPIYSLLLTTLLMVVFYALYSWRSFKEREQFMARLRPFVSTQNLISHLLSDTSDLDSKALELFRAVCRDVLGTGHAQLVPLGGMASLIGPGLTYPTTDPQSASVRPPANLTTNIVSLAPADYGDYRWALPLWAERGLIGALMLGEKQDGGLYTQEEMEIAQAGGERIIDMLAGERMARNLMALQRKRVTERRIIDIHARRLLHDDILPIIHTTILELSGLSKHHPELKETIQSLSQSHQKITELIRIDQSVYSRRDTKYDVLAAIRGVVDQEFKNAFHSVTWRAVEELSTEPLVGEVILGAIREILRNAAIHGRGGLPDQPLNIDISIQRQEDILITIQDDGIGIEQSQNSGVTSHTGSGLSLHHTLLSLIGGDLTIQPVDKQGAMATIRLPQVMFFNP